MHLLIYTPNIQPRITYIFNHILVNILGLTYTFTTNQRTFITYAEAKFNYSGLPFGDELHIGLHRFIDNKKIKPQKLTFINYDTYKVPFAVDAGIFNFDIFSAAFYLLSRYEEYLPSQLDSHNRYQAENSLAFTNNFLQLPVIDSWAYALFDNLKLRYPDLKNPVKKFTFTPTIDIDNPYYLKTEGIKIKSIKILKALLKGNFSVLTHDPFDTYTYLKNLHQKYNLQPIFFFLVGNKHEYDTAPNFLEKKQLYLKLMHEISKYATIGIHPSYFSNISTVILKSELLHFVFALRDKKIENSRQHFLILSLPDTYKNLIEIGIKNDYTMGYASQTGFRASTCTPFYWYNLETEKVSNLKIHPFAVMDQTLKKYLGLSKKDALANTKTLIDEVKKVNGNFTSVWHNETLSNFGTWQGWQKVYEDMLAYAAK